MVKVKMFGIFRLDTGLKELSLEADSVKAVLHMTAEEIKKSAPDCGIDIASLKGCIIAVNGKQVKPSQMLRDGDEVWLVPAVAGG